jgi:mono/diheme cytochrome c family protein
MQSVQLGFKYGGKQERSSPKFSQEKKMENRMKNFGAMTMTAALLGGICLFSSSAKADVAAGEATYKAKCAMCHGADGKGKASMANSDLTAADVQKKSDADLSGTIANGKPPKMPAFKSLTPDQVKDVVAYIRSLKK